eukprot:scaffold108279_cov42-Prasinocladus_malaysianus.AAC.1
MLAGCTWVAQDLGAVSMIYRKNRLMLQGDLPELNIGSGSEEAKAWIAAWRATQNAPEPASSEHSNPEALLAPGTEEAKAWIAAWRSMQKVRPRPHAIGLVSPKPYSSLSD